jgi:hypothetical protein
MRLFYYWQGELWVKFSYLNAYFEPQAMELFSALTDNAHAISEEQLRKDYSKLFMVAEVIQVGLKMFMDTLIFTDKRLILVDLDGSRIEYRSIFYKSISRVSIETSGAFNPEAQLRIWISGQGEPSFVKDFDKSVDVYEVQKVLAYYALR